LTWEAVPGKTYQVFYKDRLADTEWKLMVENVEAQDPITAVEDADFQPQRFYQVIEQ